MTETARHQINESLPSLLARLWRFGLVLSGDPSTAEELVHETCLQALQGDYQIEPEARLDRWTFSILYSIWQDGLRAERIREDRGFAIPAALQSGADAGVEAEHLKVLSEVQSLPEAQRAAILLVYGEGLTYAEAGNVLGVSPTMVSGRLVAARAALGQTSGLGGNGAE